MLTRHLLHLSNEEAVCIRWRLGRPVAERRFATDDTGRLAFRRYLQDWPMVPVRVAIDLIEEDFRIETLPHLRGNDRSTVLQRRLGQLYRGTSYRMAVLQGRESGGRRDDIALCTAITQSDTLSAWLDVLGELRVPLLGIYPTALLAEPLLARLGMTQDQVLLLTPMQSGSVRLSFFQRGRLKFSRISELEPGAGADLGTQLREQARKTLQYVSAQPWYLRTLQIRTLLLANPADSAALANGWKGEEDSLQVLSPHALSRLLRMPALPVDGSATAILLHLLMRKPLAVQLAPAERRRDGQLWYLRAVLFLLSFAIGGVALVQSGLNVWTGLQIRGQQAHLQMAKLDHEKALRELQARVPATVVPPDLMSATVRFYQVDVVQRPRFDTFLVQLAAALEREPGLNLRRVVWTVAHQPGAAPGSALGLGTGTAGDNPVASGLNPHPFFIEARLEGNLAGLTDDRSAGQAAVKRLAARLVAGGASVDILRAPYDVDPTHTLTGEGGRPSREAPGFTLRLRQRLTNS